MRMIAVASCLGLVLAAASAHADIVDKSVVGLSQTSAADSRVSALDDAFATALRSAVSDILTAKDVTAGRAIIDREIIAHARRFVASFKVTSDDSATPRHLAVVVHIDRDKLNERLLELGLAQQAAAAKAQVAPAPAALVESRVLLLLRAVTPAGLFANYGTTAVASVPGSAMFDVLLHHPGMRAVVAPASGPAAHAGGELPLDDESARALAGEVKADVAVIVGASAERASQVRGARVHAAIGHTRIRVIDAHDGTVKLDVSAAAGGYGSDDDSAIATVALDRAAADAVAAAMMAPMLQSTSANLRLPNARGPRPAMAVAEGHVLVRVVAHEVGGGVATWQSTQVVRDAIAARPKSPVMLIRRLDEGEIVFDIATTESAASLGKALAATAGILHARAHDGIVDVEIEELAQ